MKNKLFINTQLKKTFGTSEIGNKAKFRLVWSEDMYEKQAGDFVERTPAGIVLRKVRGVFEVSKYSYIKDRWIIEVYMPKLQKLCDDIKEGDGYEPIWTFVSKDGGYFLPHWPEVQYIVRNWIDINTRPDGQKRTERDAKYDMEQREALEVNHAFEEMFGNDNDKLDGKFRDGSAVILGGS